MRSVDWYAQSTQGEALRPRTEERCVYGGEGCIPTTHRCNASGCVLLVCDACASNMCPDGGNENEYHWCPSHCLLPALSDSDDETDHFAWKSTDRLKTLSRPHQ